MKILYISGEKKHAKIGTSDADAQWYKLNRIEKFIPSFKKDDVIDVDSFKFEKVQEGKWTNNYVTFMKKAAGGSGYNKPQENSASNYSAPSNFDPRQNSIERQCAVKTAAELMTAFQGQYSIEEAPVLFETWFKVSLGLIKGE